MVSKTEIFRIGLSHKFAQDQTYPTHGKRRRKINEQGREKGLTAEWREMSVFVSFSVFPNGKGLL